MSALDELVEKENTSEIELCILWVLDDAEEWNEKHAPFVHANKAAEELAALRDQLAEANEIISMVDAAVHRDDVESVKSLAYEYVNKYGVQA